MRTDKIKLKLNMLGFEVAQQNDFCIVYFIGDKINYRAIILDSNGKTRKIDFIFDDFALNDSFLLTSHSYSYADGIFVRDNPNNLVEKSVQNCVVYTTENVLTYKSKIAKNQVTNMIIVQPSVFGYHGYRIINYAGKEIRLKQIGLEGVILKLKMNIKTGRILVTRSTYLTRDDSILSTDPDFKSVNLLDSEGYYIDEEWKHDT